MSLNRQENIPVPIQSRVDFSQVLTKFWEIEKEGVEIGDKFDPIIRPDRKSDSVNDNYFSDNERRDRYLPTTCESSSRWQERWVHLKTNTRLRTQRFPSKRREMSAVHRSATQYFLARDSRPRSSLKTASQAQCEANTSSLKELFVILACSVSFALVIVPFSDPQSLPFLYIYQLAVTTYHLIPAL